ncbi:6-phosphogluconolactonase [Verticiella sediminum]|uniref:6-phosphogluconolactonase n=1 Tax=Verticiella sediminum TaxID=1247510 RepID=A0A556AS84_9BURK|nr:6-phosphogluconolactonase [Verticiella sediminum]TSH95824.1 6-phosphogluconolactonase [Verticiella sediminum]
MSGGAQHDPRALPADHLVVTDDAAHLTAAIACWMSDRLASVRGRAATIAISGGRTPLALYRLLASPAWRGSFAWNRLHVFWCDERCVPLAHPENNAGAAQATWLSRVPIPATHLHPVPELPAAQAAAQYDAQLKAHYGAQHLDANRPLFDVVLLGIGADGHTASLFPGDPALSARTWACAVHRPAPPDRVTLTLPVLASTAALAFVVTGKDKHEIVQRIAAGDTSLPAAQVQTRGERAWFLDRDAAGELA